MCVCVYIYIYILCVCVCVCVVWLYHNLKSFIKVLTVPKEVGQALKQDREKDDAVSLAWGPESPVTLTYDGWRGSLFPNHSGGR